MNSTVFDVQEAILHDIIASSFANCVICVHLVTMSVVLGALLLLNMFSLLSLKMS